MAIKIGDDFKIYRDTADNQTTPTWSEITNADEELTVDLSPTDVSVPTRGDKFIGHGSGKIDATLTFGLQYDPADAHVTEFEVHVLDGGDMHVGVFDGGSGTSGTQYWHGDVKITGFSLGANLGDPGKYSVELKPSATHTSTGATSPDLAHATIA